MTLSGHFIIIYSAGQKGKFSWHQQILISTEAKHSPLYLGCEYPTSSSSSGESPDPTTKKEQKLQQEKPHDTDRYFKALLWHSPCKRGY